MNEAEKYFNAERIYCLFGAIFGVFSLGLAIYFLWKVKQPFYSGMAYPFIILGFFFLLICGSVFLRSPKDILRVNSMLQTSKKLIQAEELPRMEKVMSSFKVIIIIEIVLFLVSLFFLFVSPPGHLWKGVFAGLLIQTTFLLLFDVVAQKRGQIYLEFLQLLNNN